MHPMPHGMPEPSSPVSLSPSMGRRLSLYQRATPARQNPFAGPLSKAMWEKAHRVPSRYNDTFDYRIYDQLYDRFGDKQPRGGVVYKGTLKLLEADNCYSASIVLRLTHMDEVVSSTVPTAMLKTS